MNERETKVREALAELAKINPDAKGTEIYRVARDAGAGVQWARLMAADVFDEMVNQQRRSR